MPAKLTTEQFIEKAQAVHGGRYDYSVSEYAGSKKTLKIICSEHGEFSQTAGDHLSGSDCPRCAKHSASMKTRMGLQEFVRRANEVHNKVYDYSCSTYRGANRKIEIRCKEHGRFWQRAADHLLGHGCTDCAGLKRLDDEEFSRRAREVHGEKYDYSQSRYKNTMTKVEIICPVHGSFLQAPNAHLIQGNGCPACSPSMKDTADSFIGKAKSVHGAKYNYDLVEYVDQRHKVEIICPEHGPFKQSPNSHLNRRGCPDCGLITQSEKTRLNPDEWWTRVLEVSPAATLVSGNYQGWSSKVTLNCPAHGDYATTAGKATLYGCSKCGFELVGRLTKARYKKIRDDRQERGWEVNPRNKRRIRAATIILIKLGEIEDKDACEVCGALDDLQWHHTRYEGPGAERDVEYLCRSCHLRWGHAGDHHNVPESAVAAYREATE